MDEGLVGFEFGTWPGIVGGGGAHPSCVCRDTEDGFLEGECADTERGTEDEVSPSHVSSSASTEFKRGSLVRSALRFGCASTYSITS